MSFNSSAYLLRATARAKSDVANKLISMFLHEVSKRLCSSLELRINDPRYVAAVVEAFGPNCCYCGRLLENDRAAVEHLDGMNRLRIGLHIPGNVILACTLCNREKRRDDSAPTLTLAASGWESFLSHDGKRCQEGCKSCSYWSRVWPEANDKVSHLNAAKDRIERFRRNYRPYLELNSRARGLLDEKIHAIYRDCQVFATTRIKEAVGDVLRDLMPTEPDGDGLAPVGNPKG